MDENNKIEQLEHKVEKLTEQVLRLQKQMLTITGEKDANLIWKRNATDEFMIKLVYPGIFNYINNPTAGFPKNRKKIAQELKPGQYMFLYVTSPEKKIIGLTKVVSEMNVTEGRWPYSVDLEWVINPKPGVKFSDVGLDIRPRPGDTLYALSEEKAQELIDTLNKQIDLDQSTLDYLAGKYKE
ncbi:hypothetical protein PY093_10160 [Cytobacillus sp. S13-E01]|uniref:hypothetical protein n=1 Tax=Cytobacillus sp. S13-E01 TaxID=3031326 RepID=UPI0023D7F3F7|nr:hypothetical protein [Cytobacillus sp. S13-E01]MDF0727080.1 hypothetical protein [Cytobacillus sp. S13-E01]